MHIHQTLYVDPHTYPSREQLYRPLKHQDVFIKHPIWCAALPLLTDVLHTNQHLLDADQSKGCLLANCDV